MAGTQTADVQERIPGEQAKTPVQIPAGGWWQVTRRAFKESSADNVPMLAGGVAFFAFLAVFPALIAAVSLYGLIADPATVAEQLRSITSALPETAQPLIADQLNSVVSTSGGALTTGLVVSLLAALWSASGGTGNLMKAVNIAYDEEEHRSGIKVKAIALGLTIGAIVFVLLSLALVAVVPIVLDALQLGTVGRVIAQIVRWVVLIAVVIVALAVVYRIAPDRDAPRIRWVSVGALVAGLLWVLGSLGFSLYVNFFGNYNKTYGALAGVVVLLLWLYLTSYIVLLGAEINAESERQTRADTTRGPDQPMGTRGADAADTLAGEPRPDTPAQRIETSEKGYEATMSTGTGHDVDHPADRADLQSASTSELVNRLSTQVSELVRGEIALARSELTTKGKRLGTGAGLLGGAGVLAIGGLLAFLAAAIAALALVLPVWAAALIVGVVLLIVAGVLGLLGKKQVQQGTPPLPEQAVHGVQDDVQAIKKGLQS
jgi:membrane protein